MNKTDFERSEEFLLAPDVEKVHSFVLERLRQLKSELGREPNRSQILTKLAMIENEISSIRREITKETKPPRIPFKKKNMIIG